MLDSKHEIKNNRTVTQCELQSRQYINSYSYFILYLRNTSFSRFPVLRRQRRSVRRETQEPRRTQAAKFQFGSGSSCSWVRFGSGSTYFFVWRVLVRFGSSKMRVLVRFVRFWFGSIPISTNKPRSSLRRAIRKHANTGKS